MQLIYLVFEGLPNVFLGRAGTKYPFMLHLYDNCQILFLAPEMLHLHDLVFGLILAARVESQIRMFLVGQLQLFRRDV